MHLRTIFHLIIRMNFKNLTEQREYFKNKIYTIGLTQSLRSISEDSYNEFVWLFTKHPEYPDKTYDMVDLKIETNKLNKNAYELHLIRSDGSSEDISYRSCCQNKVDKYKQLKRAMRNSIQPQIYEFRSSNPDIYCNLCDAYSDIQVDHHRPTFRELYDNFLSSTELDIPTAFNDNDVYSAVFKKDDYLFDKDWYQYHKTHASLRYLCKKCNSGRTK